MPPRIRFAKSDIIEAGVEIVRDLGLRALSTRQVARRLKSSTAPVYSQFGSIKELELEVIKSIADELADYACQSYTDKVFLNMGTGIALYARDYPQLYRALFLERADFVSVCEEFAERMKSQMGIDLRFARLTQRQRDALLHKMWILTHGLATFICVGLTPDKSKKFIIETLVAVGSPIINAALQENAVGQQTRISGD